MRRIQPLRWTIPPAGKSKKGPGRVSGVTLPSWLLLTLQQKRGLKQDWRRLPTKSLLPVVSENYKTHRQTDRRADHIDPVYVPRQAKLTAPLTSSSGLETPGAGSAGLHGYCIQSAFVPLALQFTTYGQYHFSYQRLSHGLSKGNMCVELLRGTGRRWRDNLRSYAHW
jgi:hypothetical protein